jgi:hypothetical protein
VGSFGTERAPGGARDDLSGTDDLSEEIRGNDTLDMQARGELQQTEPLWAFF